MAKSCFGIIISPNGNTLAIGNHNEARLWDVGSWHPTEVMPDTGGARDVAFSPDGHTLAIGSDDDLVLLWDIANAKVEATLKIPHPEGRADVKSVAFSPDGRTLASGSADGTGLLWDIGTGKKTGIPKNHTDSKNYKDSINSVAFSPNGQKLVTGSMDGIVIFGILLPMKKQKHSRSAQQSIPLSMILRLAPIGACSQVEMEMGQ